MRNRERLKERKSEREVLNPKQMRSKIQEWKTGVRQVGQYSTFQSKQ